MNGASVLMEPCTLQKWFPIVDRTQSDICIKSIYNADRSVLLYNLTVLYL